MNPSSTGRKIVLIRNAYSYDFGGGERMPANIGRELKELGWRPIIVSRSTKLLDYARQLGLPAARGWWWSRQNWSGWRILLTPAYFIWQLILFVWYLCLFIKRRPSVVHAQSKDDFIAATLAARLLRKPVVWSDHADLKYVYKNVGVWYKNPIGKVVKLCAKLTQAIIITSRSDQEQIEAVLGHKLSRRYRIIYNGIVDQPELLKLYRPGKNIIFAATSRLVSAKGIGELITAFDQISSNKDYELWLFGEGPEESKFKTMSAHNKKIKFLGFPSDALEKLAKADIFVHPSYLEGFSLSLVEAAMLAKPIIACNVGGNPELIKNGHSGILVPAKNEVEMANAMTRLAADPDLRNKLAKAARLEFEKKFSLEKIVKDRYIPLYESA